MKNLIVLLAAPLLITALAALYVFSIYKEEQRIRDYCKMRGLQPHQQYGEYCWDAKTKTKVYIEPAMTPMSPPSIVDGATKQPSSS